MENVYVNIEKNHFKIWGCDLMKNTDNNSASVVLYWGKIGVPMQKLTKKEKLFSFSGDAYNYVWEKIDEKIRKGYNSMPNHQYFNAINLNKSLPKLISLIKIYKKAQS